MKPSNFTLFQYGLSKRIQRYRKSLQISKGRNKSTCYKVWRFTLLRDWPNMFFQCSPTPAPHTHFWSHFCSNLSFWAGFTVESAGYGMLRTLLEKWVIESGRQGGITWSPYSQLGPTHALETWITPPVGVRFVCTPLVSFWRFSYQDGFEEITILSPSLSCKSASLSILITNWGYVREL